MNKNTPNYIETLELLKKILPKATNDPQLAGQIYQACESELKAKARAAAFEQFCQRVELPDLDHKTIEGVRQQFLAAFGDGDVTIKPDAKEQLLTVEVQLPDGHKFSGEIKVHSLTEEPSEEQEIKLKFVPFPVCLPGDKELIWYLARQENMTGEEGAIALTRLQAEFWASKTGQRLLRDRVEKSLVEFLLRVPAKALQEHGLKRLFKQPSVVTILH